MAQTVKVGLIGFGTIGAGVVKLLRAHRAEITRRTGGRTIEITTIADLDTIISDSDDESLASAAIRLLNPMSGTPWPSIPVCWLPASTPPPRRIRSS